MRALTKERKKNKQVLGEIDGGEWLQEQIVKVISEGKQALDECTLKMGRMLAETILYIEREEIAGPDYRPKDSGIKKWASQRGSVFIGGQKVKVNRPRLVRFPSSPNTGFICITLTSNGRNS